MNDENVSSRAGHFPGQIRNAVLVVEQDQRRGVVEYVFGRGRGQTSLVADFELHFFRVRRGGIKRLDAFAVFLHARRIRVDVVQRPFVQRHGDYRFYSHPRMVLAAFQYHSGDGFVNVEYGHLAGRVHRGLSAQRGVMTRVQYRSPGIRFFVHLDVDDRLGLDGRRRHVVDQQHVRPAVGNRYVQFQFGLRLADDRQFRNAQHVQLLVKETVYFYMYFPNSRNGRSRIFTFEFSKKSTGSSPFEIVAEVLLT